MASIMDAAQHLLVEVAHELSTCNTEYVIVGGWSPYFRAPREQPHPGTKDVDVLFADAVAQEGIRDVAQHLISKGFIPSAKHDFQLLRVVRVEGQDLVFNVDLLHPSETHDNPELMVDHLDLHVVETDFGDPKFVRSIVLPSSQLLFQSEFHSDILVRSPLTGRAVPVPIITETGAILSKCESVKLKKRPRDAFDIYVSMLARGKDGFVKDLKPYLRVDGVQILLRALRDFLEELDHSGVPHFDQRVAKYSKYPHTDPPSSLIKAALAVLELDP